MEVNLFTGGKGGVGKTLMALGVSAFFLHHQDRVLVVDLNVFNPDLYIMLRRLADPQTLTDLENSPAQFQQDGFTLIPIAGDRGLLVVPDLGVYEHYQLPKGVSGFYNDYLNGVFSLPQVQQYRPRVCLVDTGFHVANLALPGDEVSENSWLEPGADNYLKQHTLNIWFVWTLSAWIQAGESNAIKRAIEQLKRGLGIGQFNELQGLRHVFNPFALHPEPSLLEYFLRPRHPLRKMAKNSTHGPQIPLSRLVEIVSTKIREQRQRGRLDRESYPRLIADTILKHMNGKRPMNFLPLLTYPHLKDYQSEFAPDDPMSVESLMNFLGEPYRLIEKYLQLFNP